MREPPSSEVLFSKLPRRRIREAKYRRGLVAHRDDTGAEMGRQLRSEGTRLYLDDQEFFFQGLSFFNALFNDQFNTSPDSRRMWLKTFLATGVSALRVWCQWDLTGPHSSFVDVDPGHSLYDKDGDLRPLYADRLVALADAARQFGMVLEVTLFSNERAPNLPLAAQLHAVRAVAELLRPFRNVLVQLWNESSIEVISLYDCAKSADSERLITSSPGFSGNLGDAYQNQLLDILTPHTTRSSPRKFWEEAPEQIKQLMQEFGKPVIDDEPARAGIIEFGGLIGGTTPEQHIAHLRAVTDVGGYYTYHHDMFQNGYGHPATPFTGIPDPSFSEFHSAVFRAMAERAGKWQCDRAVSQEARLGLPAGPEERESAIRRDSPIRG
jgi:hypothetical protein